MEAQQSVYALEGQIRQARERAGILLVGNDPRSVQILGKSLERLGHPIKKASSKQSAVEMLQKIRVELVIIKVNTSHINASAIIEKAKQINPDTMVMVITDHFDTDLITNAGELDADDYLFRPYSLAELWFRVSNCLRILEAKRSKRQSEAKISELNEQILSMLAVMAHDIRSPLISIAAITKLLTKGTCGTMDESVRNTLADLSGRVARLVGTTEDCLGKASIVRGWLEGERDELDLREDIIDPLLEELSPEIEKQEASIDNRLGAIPARFIPVKASKVWLKNVYRNLFTNAIRYGGKKCTIAFGFEPHDSFYQFNVFNSGAPVPESSRDTLFTKFCKIKNTGSAKEEGIGLGLYLVKKIVNNHGGDIWYEAKEGGSNFVFTLPRE